MRYLKKTYSSILFLWFNFITFRFTFDCIIWYTRYCRHVWRLGCRRFTTVGASFIASLRGTKRCINVGHAIRTNGTENWVIMNKMLRKCIYEWSYLEAYPSGVGCPTGMKWALPTRFKIPLESGSPCRLRLLHLVPCLTPSAKILSAK